MSISLFTIIQSEESLLDHAINSFENIARSRASSQRAEDREDVMRPTAAVPASAPAPAHSLSAPSAAAAAAAADHDPAREGAASSSIQTTAPLQPVSASSNGAASITLPVRLARPETLRRRYSPDDYPRPQTSPSTSSTPPSTIELPHAASLVHPRPRNRSPYSRAQMRSRPAGGQATSQPMARAQSLPARTSSPGALSPQVGTSSPLLRSPAHGGAPFRPSSPGADYHTMASPSFYDTGFETISEHAELDLTRSSFDRNIASLNSARPLSSNGRRTSQPPPPRVPSPSRSPLTSSASSPSLSGVKFNEAYPPPLHHSTSASTLTISMPSTPSSNRSRSPSISSLETIEDNPDLEWEAIEADRIARLKLAADTEDHSGEGGRRNGSLDIPGKSLGRSGATAGARKRWSVCGAERRADLDLETIWED